MTVRKPLPTIEALQELFCLNEAEGVLVWRARGEAFAIRYGWSKNVLAVWNAKFAGQPAGSPTKFGYTRVAIEGQRYLAHRIIWKMVNGNDPDHIDHIDGCKSNNKISNLRDVSAVENQRNRKLNSNSTSGVIGVHWCKSKQRWISRIRAEGRMRMIGAFKDREAAVTARSDAERRLGYHENHGKAGAK